MTVGEGVSYQPMKNLLRIGHWEQIQMTACVKCDNNRSLFVWIFRFASMHCCLSCASWEKMFLHSNRKLTLQQPEQWINGMFKQPAPSSPFDILMNPVNATQYELNEINGFLDSTPSSQKQCIRLPKDNSNPRTNWFSSWHKVDCWNIN